MYRKFIAVVVALIFAVGGLLADEIKGVFKKFADGKVTITVDDKDKEYTVDKDAKVKVKKEEILLTEALAKWKEGQKGTFTVEKDVVTNAKKEKRAK